MKRLFCMVALLGAALGAHATSFEELVMPGPLIQGHAKYEAQCEKCHSKFEKGAQNTLCRDCHKEADRDVRDGKGFHGRLQNADTAKCSACHTDHKGRGTNVVLLDRETFNHANTDYPLKGAHGSVPCASCHKQGKKWREAPGDCFSCHKTDDRHDKRLGEKCGDCHTTETWRKAKYDHDKTKFRLDGAHRDVQCAACHPNERYKKTPKECAACHRIDDVHGGRYDDKCASCHSTTDWKKPRFDHDKTKFPLKDKHRDVACDGCHTGDLYKEKTPVACNECHKSDDTHRGKNGTKCDSCHDQKGWSKTRFDHDRKTKFPLVGGHAKVQCESCHKGDVYKEKLDATCYSCHRGDDRHRGELGKACETCHNQKQWNTRVRFDHELTKFPLLGLHATAPCEACHLSAAGYKEAPTACLKCHEKDDEHKKRLGEACGDCHTPNGWAIWRFDHDTQTDMKLTGKHKGLDCLACHRDPMGREVRQSQSCESCHRKDDIHAGSFGSNCERCHTTKEFKEIRFR